MACRPALFLLLAGAIACSPRPPQLDCNTLALASPGAVPGSWVPILGADTAALADVAMTIQADTLEMPALVLAQDDGSAVLVAPAHPSGRLEGGAVTVVIGECAPRVFEVEPLAPAPGEVRRLMGMARAQILEGLAQFGTTERELQQGDPESPHPLMAVLGGLLEIVDAYAPDAAQVAEQGADGGAIIEAMLGHHGLVDQLAAARATQQAHSPSGNGLFMLAAARQGVLPGIKDCARPAPTAPAAADVSCWMKAALFHEIATTGTPAEILSLLGLTLSAGAVIPIPGVNQAYVAAGVGVLAYAATAQAISQLLPRRFASLEVRPSPGSQDEDENRRVRWRHYAYATAVSNTWDPTSALIDLTIARVTAKNNVLGKAWGGENLLVSAIPVKAFRQAVASNLASLFGGMLGGAALEGLAGGGGSIGPVAYTDIDVGEDRWTEARVIGEAFELGGGGELVPRQAGSASLRVTIKASEFAGQTFETETAVTITPIQVQVEPVLTRLKPRESVILTATVENAQDTRVTWRMEPNAGFRMEILPGGMSVRVTAPAQPNVRPVVVTARSEADRTFLASAPEREGSARVSGAGLALTPETACLLPGEALEYTVEADEQRAWEWSATAGAISGSGHFTAPRSGNGRATVIVSDPEDPDIKAEARVSYGQQCSCYGSVVLGTPVNRSYTGLAAWRQLDGQFTIGFTPAMSDREQLANLPARLELGTVYSGAPTVGNHALRQATLAGFITDHNQIYGIVDPDTPNTGSGLVSLQRVDADRLEGTFVGYISVLMADPGEWVQAPVTFNFRALRGSKVEYSEPFMACYLEATEPDGG
jgi:hypothetical protein